MQLSMQVCIGTKQPSIWLFAALTIASAASRVMSPCQIDSRSAKGRALPYAAASVGISASVTTPRSRAR